METMQTATHTGDCDQTIALKTENKRLRDALNEVLFLIEDPNGSLTDANLATIRGGVMDTLGM